MIGRRWNLKEEVTSMSKEAFGLLSMAGWLVVCFATAQAEPLKWRTGLSTSKADSMPVGDVPGHVVGAGESRGMAFFEKGEAAIAVDKFTFDYTNGSGPYVAYMLHSFEDGSTFVVRFVGSSAASPNGKITSFKGTFSFTQGTGRFAGIQGSGSHTGKRFAPVGAGAELYFDFTGTYTLPSR
jgi:hypothetical protein